MASRTTNRLPPTDDASTPEAGDCSAGEKPTIPTRPAPTGRERDGELEEVEAMLRTAIEVLSPDPDEIKKGLARAKSADTKQVGRQSGFRLVLAVVVLVFLILVSDLFLGCI